MMRNRSILIGRRVVCRRVVWFGVAALALAGCDADGESEGGSAADAARVAPQDARAGEAALPVADGAAPSADGPIGSPQDGALEPDARADAPDAQGDPCANIECAPGRRCNPDTQLCEGIAAGCDVVAQDCPGGEACSILQDGSIGCAPAGQAQGGATCGTAETGRCVAGYICAGTEAGGFSCLKLCNVDTGAGCGEDCCSGLRDVNVAGVCDTPPPACDLIDQACGESQKCTVVTACGDTGCVPAGDVGEGQPCGEQGADNCGAGLLCIGHGVCAGFCRETADCPDGQECRGEGNGRHCMAP